jgi:hypothetical protein
MRPSLLLLDPRHGNAGVVIVIVLAGRRNYYGVQNYEVYEGGRRVVG